MKTLGDILTENILAKNKTSHGDSLSVAILKWIEEIKIKIIDDIQAGRIDLAYEFIPFVSSLEEAEKLYFHDFRKWVFDNGLRYEIKEEPDYDNNFVEDWLYIYPNRDR